jgi:hypothetical protein
MGKQRLLNRAVLPTKKILKINVENVHRQTISQFLPSAVGQQSAGILPGKWRAHSKM